MTPLVNIFSQVDLGYILVETVVEIFTKECIMARRPSVHEQITSRKAPKPVGPYVQAVKVTQPGATLFVSGQIPIELPSGKVFTGDIKRQADLALNHLRNIVQDAGFSMDEVVVHHLFDGYG